jgi:aldose sugar dehydrogenase
MKSILLYVLFISFLYSNAQEKLKDIPLDEETKNYTLKNVISGIEIPWGMTWLPDGSMLVTEKSGVLYHIAKGNKKPVGNVPKVNSRGQGGLLDIVIHPNYAKNGWIYISYSSEGEKGTNTKIIRAKLQNESLSQIETIYETSLENAKPKHYGSRIVFDNEGYLYFTVGERGNHFVNTQDITKDGGKLYRLHDDGRIPIDNPFIEKKDAKKAIFSYGHRNQQGIAKHPKTGKIWSHEHGPQGGDEINIQKKGANYGWPVITYGIDYDGSSISNITHKEGMEQPIYQWTPSIAPSGMAFVTSDIYKNWKGHLLVGSLKFQYLELVKLNENKIVGRQKIATGIGRLRNVSQGPDGYIYIGVEGKGIYKIIPN